MTGFNGRVSYSYEVEQKLIEYETEDSLYWILSEYGDDAGATLNELEILTNPAMALWISA